MIGRMAGNFKITELIGEGGMGAVYKGIDVMLEREVAIKMLRPELARQPNLVERFRSEAVTLAKLNHPNIATLYSFLRQGDDFFMVMEYVRGDTLDSVLRLTGAMLVQQATRLFCHALEGIEHAHEMGIIHRDIKPANIMLTANGSIKVMDFGIARVLGADRMTRTGHLIGTVEYMSPEQVKGEETDARSDIYSLGMLLYEMLTGRLPFNTTSEYELMRSQIEEAPKPPTVFAPHVPLAIEKVIMRALAKRPDARFQTARNFRVALEQALSTTRNDLPAMGNLEGKPRDAQRTLLDAPSPLAAQHIEPPETRLGAAPPIAPSSPQPKETRMAPPGYQAVPTQPVYQQGAYRYQGYAAQPSQPASPSLLSRLNWKHYTLAGALLVSLIALPIVLLSGTSREPVEHQPAPPVPRQPEPSPSAAAPLVGPNTPTAPIPEETLPGEPGNTGAARSAGSHGGREGQSIETRRAQAASEHNQDRFRSPSASREPSSPRTAREVPAPEEPQPSRADDNQKKNKAGKIGEATEAVGGAIKKLGGLFGGKKKEKH